MAKQKFVYSMLGQYRSPRIEGVSSSFIIWKLNVLGIISLKVRYNLPMIQPILECSFFWRVFFKQSYFAYQSPSLMSSCSVHLLTTIPSIHSSERVGLPWGCGETASRSLQLCWVGVELRICFQGLCPRGQGPPALESNTHLSNSGWGQGSGGP